MLKHKIVGVYELITGITGVILILSNTSKVIENPETVYTFIGGIILFGATAFAGFALLKKFKIGIRLSMWSQSLQTVSFIYQGFQYLFTGSAFLCLVYHIDLNFKYQLTPIAYNISKISTVVSDEIRLYFIPLVILLLLRPDNS